MNNELLRIPKQTRNLTHYSLQSVNDNLNRLAPEIGKTIVESKLNGSVARALHVPSTVPLSLLSHLISSIAGSTRRIFSTVSGTIFSPVSSVLVFLKSTPNPMSPEAEISHHTCSPLATEIDWIVLSPALRTTFIVSFVAVSGGF